MIKKGASKTREGDVRRQHGEIMNGGFGINKTIRIERTNDPDAISEAWCDYSKTTLSRLYEQGKKDTLKALLDHLQQIIDDEMNSTDNIKNKLRNPLEKAKQVLSQAHNTSYYEDVWIPLSMLTEEIASIEESEQVALFRP